MPRQQRCEHPVNFLHDTDAEASAVSVSLFTPFFCLPIDAGGFKKKKERMRKHRRNVRQRFHASQHVL